MNLIRKICFLSKSLGHQKRFKNNQVLKRKWVFSRFHLQEVQASNIVKMSNSVSNHKETKLSEGIKNRFTIQKLRRKHLQDTKQW